MPCDPAKLQAYHDRELTPPARAAIEAHLTHCAACRESLAQIRQTSNLISSAPLPAMPLAARIRFFAAWDDAQAFRDRSVLRVASWLTAVAAAILIGGLISLNWPNPNRPAPGKVSQWETVAVLPPADVSAESGPTTELFRVAQWQADDLAVGDKRGGDSR